MNRFDENVATLLPGLVAVRREQETTLPSPPTRSVTSPTTPDSTPQKTSGRDQDGQADTDTPNPFTPFGR